MSRKDTSQHLAIWHVLRVSASRNWRHLVLLLTSIAFVLMVATTATHQHKSNIEDRACTVCTAVAHQFSDIPPALAVAQTLSLLIYQLHRQEIRSFVFSAARLLPPSCGPPHSH